MTRIEIAFCELNDPNSENDQLDKVMIQSNHSRMSLLTIKEEINKGLVENIETKWAAESEERIDAVDRGELQTV